MAFVPGTIAANAGWSSMFLRTTRFGSDAARMNAVAFRSSVERTRISGICCCIVPESFVLFFNDLLLHVEPAEVSQSSRFRDSSKIVLVLFP